MTGGNCDLWGPELFLNSSIGLDTDFVDLELTTNNQELKTVFGTDFTGYTDYRLVSRGATEKI